MKEEAVAAEKTQETEEMKASCEADLAEAMPALKEAVAALNAIDKGHITEMKKMSNPPKGVKLVMEGVCVMLQVSAFVSFHDPQYDSPCGITFLVHS